MSVGVAMVDIRDDFGLAAGVDFGAGIGRDFEEEDILGDVKDDEKYLLGLLEVKRSEDGELSGVGK